MGKKLHDGVVAVIKGKTAVHSDLSAARWKHGEGNSARGSCAQPRYKTREVGRARKLERER